MTKTLTEQWRDGTLEQRYYYVKHFGNGQKPFVEIELKNFLLDLFKAKDRYKIEVLAPVPSYEEWQSYDKCADMLIDVNKKWHKTIVENKKLKKKLEIATKALNDILNDGDDYWDKDKAQEALTKMKGVK